MNSLYRFIRWDLPPLDMARQEIRELQKKVNEGEIEGPADVSIQNLCYCLINEVCWCNNIKLIIYNQFLLLCIRISNGFQNLSYQDVKR